MLPCHWLTSPLFSLTYELTGSSNWGERGDTEIPLKIKEDYTEKQLFLSGFLSDTQKELKENQMTTELIQQSA